MTQYQLAVLDMAGTTVADDGLVVEAFTRAIASAGVEVGSADYDAKLGYVHDTMGESKITVFRALLDGDEARAQAANLAFEAAYGDLVAAGKCAPIDGAEDAIHALRAAGVKVALTTGFGRPTQDAILAALGWTELADLSLCPADVGRGRPYPDLVLGAVLRLGVDDLRAVAVVGDTAFDVLTGLRSGASIAAGVLTGAHDRAAFEAAGATHVLDSIRDLPALLQG
ncbi:phosphonatase-like hydrolase [Streptomyces sp. SID3343]|uniref:phosphonatase-like hydrolase n=1 Tax=Streptomyces sp. SID3343 TaxID=2690260 RepID=UPI0013695D0D|nr:phosphonatase-like hydrolase [Streptomyces sp. SID3343]MYW01389.1 phosphonatase-like hydrolase [Streptomyces sp. SID3343]